MVLLSIYIDLNKSENLPPGGVWRTIRGARVYIKDGQIHAGPDHIKGKKIEDLKMESVDRTLKERGEKGGRKGKEDRGKDEKSGRKDDSKTDGGKTDHKGGSREAYSRVHYIKRVRTGSESKRESYGMVVHKLRDKQVYIDAIKEVKGQHKYGAFVDVPEGTERKFFMSDDGDAGVVVEDDGNIKSVFQSPDTAISYAARRMLLHAIEEGGNHLDCFDGKLRYMYEQFGFKPVARLRFDPEYAPEGWNFERDGQPDVVFFTHNGDPVDKILETDYPSTDMDEVPVFDDYDEAVAVQKKGTVKVAGYKRLVIKGMGKSVSNAKEMDRANNIKNIPAIIVSKSIGREMEQKYPGGRWVTIRGNHVYIKADGTFAPETTPSWAMQQQQFDSETLYGYSDDDLTEFSSQPKHLMQQVRHTRKTIDHPDIDPEFERKMQATLEKNKDKYIKTFYEDTELYNKNLLTEERIRRTEELLDHYYNEYDIDTRTIDFYDDLYTKARDNSLTYDDIIAYKTIMDMDTNATGILNFNDYMESDGNHHKNVEDLLQDEVDFDKGLVANVLDKYLRDRASGYYDALDDLIDLYNRGLRDFNDFDETINSIIETGVINEDNMTYMSRRLANSNVVYDDEDNPIVLAEAIRAINDGDFEMYDLDLEDYEAEGEIGDYGGDDIDVDYDAILDELSEEGADPVGVLKEHAPIAAEYLQKKNFYVGATDYQADVMVPDANKEDIRMTVREVYNDWVEQEKQIRMLEEADRRDLLGEYNPDFSINPDTRFEDSMTGAVDLGIKSWEDVLRKNYVTGDPSEKLKDDAEKADTSGFPPTGLLKVESEGETHAMLSYQPKVVRDTEGNDRLAVSLEYLEAAPKNRNKNAVYKGAGMTAVMELAVNAAKAGIPILTGSPTPEAAPFYKKIGAEIIDGNYVGRLDRFAAAFKESITKLKVDKSMGKSEDEVWDIIQKDPTVLDRLKETKQFQDFMEDLADKEIGLKEVE